MQWGRNVDSQHHSSEMKDNSRKLVRGRVGDSLFNRITRDCLLQSSQAKQGDDKANAVFCKSLQLKSASKAISNTSDCLNALSHSQSLQTKLALSQFNTQERLTKIKEIKGNGEHRYQKSTKMKKDRTSPERGIATPHEGDTNSNISFENANTLSGINPYTPTKYTKSKVMSQNSTIYYKSPENEGFLPERSPNKCRNMSLSQIKPSTFNSLKANILANEKSYQIRRYRHLRNYRFSTNPQVRERAGRVIQHWWKQVQSFINSVIMIQSTWRGYKFKKQLYGIISVTVYYQRFCHKLYGLMRRKAREHYFSSVFIRKRSILLLKILKIKQRQYFNRWEWKTRRTLQLHRIAIKLFIVRNRHYNSIKSLKAYFRIWMISAQHMLQVEEKNRQLSEMQLRYKAINALIKAIDQWQHKRSLRSIRPALTQYLKAKARQRTVHFITKRSANISKILLKRGICKWSQITTIENKKIRLLSYLLKQKQKNILKLLFDYFKKGLIEDLSSKVKQMNFFNVIASAINHLGLFTRLKAYKTFNFLLKQIKFEKRVRHNLQKQHKRHFLSQYLKIIMIMKNEEKLRMLLQKHFNCFYRNEKTKTKLRYFFKWKARSKMIGIRLNACHNTGAIIKSIEKHISKKVIDAKEVFYRLIETRVHSNAKTRVLLHIVNKNSHHARQNAIEAMRLRYHLWKKKISYERICSLKGYFIQNVSHHQLWHKENASLFKAFNHWKIVTYLFKMHNDHDKRQNIAKAVSILNNLKVKEITAALRILMMQKLNYSKGEKLFRIALDLSSSVIRLRLCFSKWRLFQMKEAFDNSILSLTMTLHTKQIEAIRSRNDKGEKIKCLLKYLMRWYYNIVISNKNDKNSFLLNLNEGIAHLSLILTQRYLQMPFHQVKGSGVNPCNSKIIRLKAMILHTDKQRVTEAWIRLKERIHFSLEIHLKGKKLFRGYSLSNQLATSQLLLKKFFIWKLNRPLKRSIADLIISSFVNHLEMVMIFPQLKEALNSIKHRANQSNRDQLMLGIHSKRELKHSKVLKNALLRWSLKRKTLLISLYNNKNTFVMKQAFNRLASWAAKSRKALTQIKKGSRLITKALLEANRMHWDVLSYFRKHNQSSKVLRRHILAQLKSTYEKKMIQCFNLWRLTSTISLMKDYEMTRALQHQLNRRKSIEDKCLRRFMNRWHSISPNLGFSIHGQSLYSALLGNNKYLVKSIFLRNISMRQYFNSWKQRCQFISSLEQKHFLIKRLVVPKMKALSLSRTKAALERWRLFNHTIELRGFKLKYLHLIFSSIENGRNAKFLINYFKTWQFHYRAMNEQSLTIMTRVLEKNQKSLLSQSVKICFKTWEKPTMLKRRDLKLKHDLSALQLRNDLFLKRMLVKWRKNSLNMGLLQSSITIQKCFRNRRNKPKAQENTINGETNEIQVILHKLIHNRSDRPVNQKAFDQSQPLKQLASNRLDYHKGLSCNSSKTSSRLMKWNKAAKALKRNEVIFQMISSLKDKCRVGLWYYFIAWKNKSFKCFYTEQARIIQSFLLKRLNNQAPIKTWRKLLTTYQTRQRIRRLKANIGVQRISRFIHNKRLTSLFRKWKSQSDSFNLQHLSTLFTKSFEDIIKLNHYKRLNSFYRLYIFKILSHIIKLLKKEQFKRHAQVFMRQFTLYSEIILQSSFNKAKGGAHDPQLTRLVFKVSQSKSNRSLPNNTRYLLLTLPLLIPFLHKLISKANSSTLNDLKAHSSSRLSHIKCNNSPLLPRNIFMNLIKVGIRLQLQPILKKLIEKKRLSHLIEITMKHKTKVMIKKTKYSIAIWHVYTGLMYLKRSQLTVMEKNYLDTYHILSNLLFGQGATPNPTVLEELKELYNQLH